MLGQSQPAARAGLGPGALLSPILLLIAACGLFGQSDVRPAFQAASIKPNTELRPRGMGVRMNPGGRLTTQNAPVRLLIQNAYSLQAFQIVGGPAWIDSDGYDIEAKPEGSANRAQVMLMLQTLLAERFKLAVHRETRELPVYALTAQKDGLKLPPATEGTCVSLDPSALPPPVGPGQLRPCGSLMIAMSPSGLRMEGLKVSMAEFARILGMVVGRAVIDRTGFQGTFDVSLPFTPDEYTMGLPGAGGPGDPGGPPLPTDPTRPNIFAALQEQMGLKLETSRGPVDVLVIDHVERPSGN